MATKANSKTAIDTTTHACNRCRYSKDSAVPGQKCPGLYADHVHHIKLFRLVNKGRAVRILASVKSTQVNCAELSELIHQMEGQFPDKVKTDIASFCRKEWDHAVATNTLPKGFGDWNAYREHCSINTGTHCIMYE